LLIDNETLYQLQYVELRNFFPPNTTYMLAAPTFDAADVFPLELLASGQIAQVDCVMGDTAHVHRLEEMGLRAGAIVEMVQSGSPCIIRLSGAKLCFRESELLQVLVRRGAAA
jgi:ferrous iron transport protein A